METERAHPAHWNNARLFGEFLVVTIVGTAGTDFLRCQAQRIRHIQCDSRIFVFRSSLYITAHSASTEKCIIKVTGLTRLNSGVSLLSTTIKVWAAISTKQALTGQFMWYLLSNKRKTP